MARPGNGKPIKVVNRMLPLQDGRCWWCGCIIREQQGSAGTPSVEHLTPRAHGGKNDLENLVIACWPCNNARDTDTELWKMHPALATTSRALYMRDALALRLAMGWPLKDTPHEPNHSAHVRDYRRHMHEKAALALSK